MIYKNKDRSTVILYPTGTCNLKCKYCNIDKNPYLQTIDEQLCESFKDDYYINRIHQYFPQKYMLKSLETWGGEPFLHMERIYPTLHKIINDYPFFSRFYSSTNFSFSTWPDQLFNLFYQFGQYPYRKFEFILQLSIDGPTEINDKNRGIGVTERCLNNLHVMIERIKAGELPDNITLFINIKGTLDDSNIRKLCDKEALIQYFQFLENNYIEPIKLLNKKNIVMRATIPNTAVPSPTTVESGKIFAKLCKLCCEIETDNFFKHYFKYYKNITPLGENRIDITYNEPYNYFSSGCLCGTGKKTIGLLPNDLVAVCNEGFVDLLSNYREYAAKTMDQSNSSIILNEFINEENGWMCLSDDMYHLYEEKINTYWNDNSTARLANDTCIIMALALAGQIDKKYINEEVARQGALFCLSCSSYCVKDNYHLTGSLIVQPVGLFKLLLNGAREYIELTRQMDLGEQ